MNEQIQKDSLLLDISFDKKGLVDENNLHAKNKIDYNYSKGSISSSVNEPKNPFPYYFDFSKNIQSTRKATLSDFNICEQTNQIDTSDQIIYKRQENYRERKRIKP